MVRKAFLVAISCLVFGGGLTHAQHRIWQPYIELEGRANNLRQLGQGNLFLPLRQDCDSLLFADLRGHWTDGQAAEGNWGLAYRKISPSNWIIGAHLFYDLRHTEFNNTFHQGTAGLELLNVNWGFRVNGYIPDQGVKAAPGANAAFLQGGNIVVRPGVEAAYWGVDFEAERLLWYNDPSCQPKSDCCQKPGIIERLSSIDAELWAAAGVFHFDNNGNGFQNITGPRVRAELRLYDLPMIGNDSRLVLSGQYEYDGVRGSVGSGMLTVRIPFGPGGRRRTARLTGLDRRMVAPIVRDIDIVSVAGPFGPPEQAKFAFNGQTISRAIVVDGSTVNPEGVIEGAGANSLVIADGGAGPINPADTVDMPVGQVVQGGGSDLAVVGCNTGAPAVFTAPGTRPTINSSFVMNNGGGLIGVDINGQGTTAAVQIAGNGTYSILNNTITNVDNSDTNNVMLPDGATTVDIAEMGIFGSGFGGEVVIADNTVNTPGTALFLAPTGTEIDVADSSFTATETTDGDSSGLDLRTFGSAQVTASFSGSSFTGYQAGVRRLETYDTSTLTASFNDCTFLGSGTNGSDGFKDIISHDDSMVMATFTDSTFNGGTGNSSDGFEDIEATGGMVMASFTNCTFNGGTGNSSDGFEDIEPTGDGAVTATFTNCTFNGGTGNSSDGFEDIEGSGTTVASFTNCTFNGGAGDSSDGFEDIESSGMKTVSFTNCNFNAGTGDHSDGFEDIEGSGMKTVSFTNCNFNAGSGDFSDGFEDIEGSATTVATFTNCNFNAGAGENSDGFEDIEGSGMQTVSFTNCNFNAGSGDRSNGFEDIEPGGDAMVTFNNCNFNAGTGASSDGFDDIQPVGNSMVIVTFTNSNFNAGTGASSDGFDGIEPLNNSTVIATFTNNNFTGGGGLDAESFGTSTLCLNAMNNTLTPGGFDLNQNAGSTFNVVDFANLSLNNNGATVNSTGTINDVSSCP